MNPLVINSASSRSDAIHLARQFLAKNPVYFDTETTGLDARAEIIEIAVIDSDGSALVNSLVRPLKPIPPDATRIHGINERLTAKAPTWILIRDDVRGSFHNRPFAAYNVDFDLTMIRQTEKAYRLDPWQPLSESLDIMKIFADFRANWDPTRNQNRYFSLEKAGSHLGIAMPNSHRALDDAMLAREVLIRIAEASA